MVALTDPALLSASAITVAAWAFIALERRFPYDRGQKLFRAGWFTDFFWYTLVQSWLCGRIIFGAIGWLDAHGWRAAVVGEWPFAAQLGFFLVTHDLYIYWFHRAQHRSPLLWRIHEAHHSARDVDWVAGSRSHALEILVNQTVEYAPIVLLGAPPELVFVKGAIDGIWGMYIHSNIDAGRPRKRGGRAGWLQKIINGPEMHRWHHSLEYRGDGVNFGTKLAVWDWLFGTAHLPEGKPPGYGLAEPYPEGYFAQLWRPFELLLGRTRVTAR